MAKVIAYIDGVTGLGEHEGDLWPYGARFQVPYGDREGVRNHVFLNEGRFFNHALGGDYDVWWGEISHIAPPDKNDWSFPWFQCGLWHKWGVDVGAGYAIYPWEGTHRTLAPAPTWWARTGNVQQRNYQLCWTSTGYPAFGNHSVEVGKWVWIEHRCYTHTSNGIVEVRLNGSSIGRLEGIQTAWVGGTGPPSGEINMNSMRFWYQDYYEYHYENLYDDMYFMFADTEGELDWLDKSVAEPLFPIADGAENQGTPNGPAAYSSVNYPIEDGLYIESSTGKDSFAFSNLEDDRSRTVHGLKVTCRARKNNTGSRKIRPFVRVNGTYYYGSWVYLGSQWREYIHIWDENPDTSVAWTPADVNAAQYGYEVST
jgi:hypothetical protein